MYVQLCTHVTPPPVMCVHTERETVRDRETEEGEEEGRQGLLGMPPSPWMSLYVREEVLVLCCYRGNSPPLFLSQWVFLVGLSELNLSLCLVTSACIHDAQPSFDCVCSTNLFHMN